MTISRVKPSNWSTNEKLTSAQMNAVDTNITYTLDKRAGQTDTLSSAITVAVGASLNFVSTSEINGNAVFDFTVEDTSTIVFDVGSTLLFNGVATCNFQNDTDFSLKIADKTSNSAPQTMKIYGQKPYASAVGDNGIAGDILLNIPASTATPTSTGSIKMQEGSADLLVVTRYYNPTNDASLANGTAITAATNFSISISGSDADGSHVGGDLLLNAGASIGASKVAGHIALTAGSASGATSNGGAVVLQSGGASGSSTSSGGAIQLVAGAGTYDGGDIVLTPGEGGNVCGYSIIKGANRTSSGSCGEVQLIGGGSSVNSSVGGHIRITGGAITGTGANAGYVYISGGDATSSGSFGGGVHIYGGASAANTSSGHISICGGISITGSYQGNISLGTQSGVTWNSAQGVIFIADNNVDPSAAPTGGCYLWFDTSDNALKVRFPGEAAKTVTVA